jgi:hypothetical protein
MSESDSSIPQKLADLAKALSAVYQSLGVGSGLYRPFHSWFRDNGPDAKPWDRDSRERLQSCVKAASEFVKEVDTANRMLNAIPVSVLEPLSKLIGGMTWDVQTRRTLRAIQYEAAFLKSISMAPSMLDSLLSSMGKDGFKQQQSKLLGCRAELTERLMDLNSLNFQSYTTWSEKEAPPPEEERLRAKSGGDPSSPTKTKRGTQRGEGREKLIAALTKHHKYADGSALNQEPIGNNTLARLAGVSVSTASEFFKKAFGGTEKYRAACSKLDLLIPALKLLNNEYSPHLLFGDNPPEAASNPKYKSDRHRKPRSSELGHNSD